LEPIYDLTHKLFKGTNPLIARLGYERVDKLIRTLTARRPKRNLVNLKSETRGVIYKDFDRWIRETVPQLGIRDRWQHKCTK